jgi:hypothetical protein
MSALVRLNVALSHNKEAVVNVDINPLEANPLGHASQ